MKQAAWHSMRKKKLINERKKNYADDNNSNVGNDEDKRVFFKISIFITNNGRQNPLPH